MIEMQFSSGSGVNFSFDVSGSYEPEPEPVVGILSGIMMPVMAGALTELADIDTIAGTAVLL